MMGLPLAVALTFAFAGPPWATSLLEPEHVAAVERGELVNKRWIEDSRI